MKPVLLVSITLLVVQTPPVLEIQFWNLENFFDCKDGGTTASDAEFSARGERHWTRKRYDAKCSAVAKTILWTGDRTGRLPDVVAVAEVENRRVLADLTRNTPLRKAGYGIIHYDSPDPRGIDVALIYRTKVHPPDTLYLLVNHHPSKYGGPSSAPRRAAAIARLRAVCDSLQALGARKIILTGDFNDTPDNPLFGSLGMRNLAEPLASRGEGTIRFGGRWELIDMFFVPEGLDATMEILRPPFLLVRDNVHPGQKPFRTWSGPRYAGGVSDHLPILLTLPGDLP